jgi:MFS family permease
MSVAQSAIISQWFKGKELGFALGLNLTVARLASVVGGIIIPIMIVNDGDRVNTVMWFGSGLCVFSLIAGILLVVIDAYAEKKDGGKVELSAEDKF